MTNSSERFAPLHNQDNIRINDSIQTEALGAKSWEEKWAEIKEKEWETDLGLLVISGKPGAGTSSAASILSQLYQAELYKAGDTIRELADNTERAPQHIKRSPTIDHEVDQEVRAKTRGAQKGKPVIVEAQIGGVTVLDEIQNLKNTEGKYPEAPVIRILFWATKEERLRRLKAASDENTKRSKKELVSKITSTPEPEIRRALEKELSEIKTKTNQQIWEDTTARERDDLTYWRELYPSLIGEDNPLEKGARDAEGDLIYNTPVFDNTEWGTPERSAYEVHEFLTEMGIVRPKIEMHADQPITLERYNTDGQRME